MKKKKKKNIASFQKSMEEKCSGHSQFLITFMAKKQELNEDLHLGA